MIRRALGRLGTALLRVGDTPERTAAAFAAGVFIGFSPLVGIQTLLALLVAVLLRLNRLAMLAGVYVNLPWLMAPYYAGATAAGAWLLGQSLPPGLAARIDVLMGLPSWRAQVEGLATLVAPFFWSYALGSSLGCTLLAAIAYPAALRFVRRRRRADVVSPDFRQPG
ncbi:MAG TPA: DUF2062 domain-containing protein [Vicinamibacterales bacterium]